MTDVPSPLAAALADRYRIERELGAGGMATVYLAEDLKHQRKVAVKVLRPDLAAALGHERFLREIMTTANLRHPHILPLYDSGDAAGFLFYVMPFVDGESLRDRMDRETQLPVDEALQIARELADALSYAHARGVIHRDIKPENVLLEHGHAVVADFGIARAVTSAGGEKLTQTGLAIGTPLYMSPEQASGMEAVDARSDLYSLACVLYEMLAGQPPFTGPSLMAVMARHALDPVPPLRTTRPGLPVHVAEAIEKALAKAPADRYSTVPAWREALTGPAATTSVPAMAAAAPDTSGTVGGDDGFRVAVLPFRYSGTNADLTSLADGLSEEIVTGLSRFSYLRVIARSAALLHTGETVGAHDAAGSPGARYVLEGSLRHAGTRLRVAVQLTDTTTGAHLWAENYERAFDPETLFDLQDELVPRIVSTIADMHGVLPRSMGEALRGRSPEQLSPYEAVLRSFAYPQRGTAEELAAARASLELAVQRAPDHGDAWAMLAFLCVQDYAQGFDLQADSLKRGLVAARRAVEAAPSSHLAHLGLAQALFFHREFQGFRSAAERAVALNPMDGHSIAFMGELLCYAGDLERGLALAGRAKQLNPHHPGWYWAADFYDAYRRRDYRAALDCALKDNMPGHWAMHAMLAAAYGQLGQHDAAAAAVQDLLTVAPGFAATARQGMSRWWEPEYVEQMIDGWRKAGMDVPPDTARPPSSATRSGATRADEGFWIAVLPFKCAGGGGDLTALADGLSEGIITGLSRFSYLRVVARGTAQRHAAEAVDVRDAARDLGARYVMEGSLRQAGTRLRVAVQLIDATTGANLWAESYERALSPEAAFELQDDLVARVVATCGDRFGVLARNISDAIRGKPPATLGPYEALMRGFGYHQRLTPVEHLEARAALERAVEQAPANADCWAMLSWVYAHEHAHGFNPQPHALDRALAAARRAVDLAPSNQLAQQALAVVLFFRKETAGCLSAAERAMALNPLDTSNEAIFLITFTGDWERGCTLIRQAMELNPHHPRWYELILGLAAYRLGDYRAAVDEVVKANAPDVFWTNMTLAAAHGQLGALPAARDALDALLAQKEDFPRSGAQLLAQWFDPQLVGGLMEGLRKAGLEIAASDTPASTAPPPVAGPSVAVLPFANMSADPADEFFADGITEEIINALAQLPGLRVAARTSCFAFKGKPEDLRVVAEKLGVGTVMEGSVRKAGGRLRVTAQLINAADGYHLWSERYDRELRDVFAMQDEIAGAIAARLQLSLAGKALARTAPASSEAYELQLKGRVLLNRRGGAIVESRACLEQAVALDAGNAEAHGLLGDCYRLHAVYGIASPAEMIPRARAAAERALALDAGEVEALATLANIAASHDWDLATSLAFTDRALARNPAHVRALCERAVWRPVLDRSADVAASLADLGAARRIDPLNAWVAAMEAFCLTFADRLDEALGAARRAMTLDPDHFTAHWTLVLTLAGLGRHEEALTAAEAALLISGRSPRILAEVAAVHAARGDSAAAEAVHQEVRSRARTEYIGWAEQSAIAAAAGHLAEARTLARTAVEARDLFLVFWKLAAWTPLRADPEGLGILRSTGLLHP